MEKFEPITEQNATLIIKGQQIIGKKWSIKKFNAFKKDMDRLVNKHKITAIMTDFLIEGDNYKTT